MAYSLNKVTIIGYVGKMPDMRYTQGGTPVANFSVATTQRWKGNDGSKQEKTEWHRIVAWGKTAEIVQEYVNKGTHIFIEGRIETRSWTDQTGSKRYMTEIIAQNIGLLGGPRNQEDNQDVSDAAEPTEAEMAAAEDGVEGDVPF